MEKSESEPPQMIDGDLMPGPSATRLFEFMEAGEDATADTPAETLYKAGFAAQALANCAGEMHDSNEVRCFLSSNATEGIQVQTV